MKKEKRPQIIFTQYSPYMLVDVDTLMNSKKEILKTGPVISLCRCGKSKFAPYCDGSHSKVGFLGEKEEGRTPDKLKNYIGKDITIHDNRGVCCHDGACIHFLPSVFKKDDRPWIDPDGASVGEVIEVIEKCPSGALSYTIGKKRYQEQNNETVVKIAKDGPIEVKGGIELKDDLESIPECKEHYTLCRCGGSKNKPFCDGAHSKIKYKDEKN